MEKPFVAIAGCLCVGFAVWVTKEVSCLWALLIVAIMVNSCGKDDCNEKDSEI